AGGRRVVHPVVYWCQGTPGPLGPTFRRSNDGTSPVDPHGIDPLRPSRVALQTEFLGNLRPDQSRRKVHRSPLSPGRGGSEVGCGAEALSSPSGGSAAGE